MANESVDKVAARISLDVTPALAQLGVLSAGLQQTLGDSRLVQASTQMNNQLLSGTEQLQSRLKQSWTSYFDMLETQQKAAMDRINSAAKSSGTGNSPHGFRISPTEMAKDMLLWSGFSAIFENIQTGLIDISKDAAGLQQVFHGDIQTQQQLNSVTNDFIDIAKQYGASVDEVLQAGKLWGRQYSEQIAEVLTSNSTLLSIVDNLSVTDANKAVESSMQALGMQVTNVNDAYTNSMRIIDSWTSVSHSTSVSTKDLADGFERAAASAKLVGLNVDQLSALVAAGVRNSGRTGTVVGNMWKSVLDNIETGSPKVQKAFEGLGISMYTVGANGQKQLKPIWDLLLQLSQAAEHATASQTQYFSAIAGGKYQFDTLKASVTDFTTIQNAYNESTKSAGTTAEKAQAQMHTLAAELTRLKDTVQQIAYNAESGALGDVLKGIVVGITDLLNGLDKMPPVAGYAAIGFIGIVSAGKLLTSTLSGLTSLTNAMINGLNFWIVGAQRAALAITGKAAAVEADTVATSAEVVATEAATGALESEAVAAGEATTAFFALDAASGGLALAVGVVLTGIVALVSGLGSQTKATQDANFATQQLNEQLQQESQQAQSAADTTIQHVNQLQSLKSSYEQATNALAHAKTGSEQAKKAESDLMDIRQQMIGIIGQEKTDEILKSQDVKKAIDEEVQAMLDANVTELTAINDRLKNQQMMTDGFITESNKRIGQLQTEMDAIAQSANMVNGYRGQFAYDMQSIHQLTNTMSTSDVSNRQAIADQQESIWQRTLGYKNYQQRYGGPLSDAVAQAQAQADVHRTNPNQTYGTVYGGGSGESRGGSGGGSSSKPSYLDRFSNLSKNDDMALQTYESRISNTSYALDRMNQAFGSANEKLKVHETDTKAASEVVKAYNDDVKALNDHANSLAGENWQLRQSIDGVSKQMNKVNADYKAHKIDAETHKQALYDLGQEFDRLTQKIQDNDKAIQQDKDSIVQATSEITSTITDMLQQAYEDEQKIQEQALQNIYQPQIDALKQEADAIDGVIKKLQEQWSAQDEVNQLADLQNQLANVKADKRFEIVGTDGKLTYTYDTAKATDLEKQIADQQTKIQRDSQLQQLQDQKDALDKQITNLQNAYANAKQQLDDYWQYKLGQDQLKSDADNLILKNGMDGALNIVQSYAGKIITQYQAIQQAAAQAGGSLASTLGGNGVPMTGATSSGAVTSGSSKTAPNGEKYTIWSDVYHEYFYGNNFTDTAHAAGGYWDNHQWHKMKTGGMVPMSAGVSGIDSVPTMLTPGEIVAPSWEDLMKGFSKTTGSGTVIQVNGNLSFPNITKPSDAELFIEQLTETVGVQRH